MERYYEILILYKIVNDSSVSDFHEKIRDEIKKHANIIDEFELGRKKLAYPIKKENRGEYLGFIFSTQDFPLLKELDRLLKLSELVLKHQNIKLNKHEVENLLKRISNKKEKVVDATQEVVQGEA